MASRIKHELTDTVPNLSGIGISPTVLERYRVVEARTNLGRRIAIPYQEDCTKLLSPDGSSVWDGDYVPGAGLFGQREAKVRTFVLCAHEFEALRVASAIEGDPAWAHLHAVALPTTANLGRLGLTILVDSIRASADELWVWNGTLFEQLAGGIEQFVGAVSESASKLKVETLSMGRNTSPLDMTDAAIRKVLGGARRKWSPSNLVTASEIYESADFFKALVGYSTGIDGLDAFIRKLRISELTMFVAGTGVGKSTLLRQIVWHLAQVENRICGVAFLEETRKETLMKFASIHYKIPFNDLTENPKHLSDKQWADFLKLPGVANLRFITQDDASGGFGGMDIDVLLSAARYMKRTEGLDFLAVDHISIMVSGKESSREGERKDIDILMTKLATACVMLEVGILGVCHLSKPDNKPHEEGGRVFLQHMRGSGTLKQLSWCVIAQERNQQAGNSRLVLVRVLKNRNGGGRTGMACALEFTDPLLIERKDVDLNNLAKEMASKKGSQEESGRSNPFATKPGRKVSLNSPDDDIDLKRGI